jgi:vancomycin resistance protein YoaR
VTTEPRLRAAAAAPPPPPHRRAGRTVAVVLGVAFGLWVLLLAADRGFAGAVPRGMHVAGVDVGARSRAAAAEAVRRGLADRASAPIVATAEGRPFPLRPAESGLSLEVAATVDAAARRTLDPLSAVRHLLGLRTSVAPRAAVDVDALRAAVLRIAARVDPPARDGGIAFRGTTPVVTTPTPGRRLDVEDAVVAVRSAYLRTSTVALPSRTSRPAVPQQEIDRALREIARPAVAAPVTVTAGGRTAVLQPAHLAAGLTITPDADGRLQPHLDGAAVLRAAGQRLAALGTPAVDARYRAVKKSLQLLPARRGRAVPAVGLARALLPVLDDPPPRRVEVALAATAPKVTTEELQRLGMREIVGSFTTHHPCCAPRVRNIHRMADIVNGHVVAPGETFSLNGLVGERTRAKGFVEAPMIEDGLYRNSVGGGVSQFATTMFNAVFFGGFEDVQHKPHSYWISRYPEGRESTVSYPQPDFRWRNDSPYGVLVQTKYTGTSLTVRLWSTKRFDIESVSSGRYAFTDPPAEVIRSEKEGCEPSSGRQGWSINVTRVFKRDGQVIRRQVFRTTYLPEPHVVCGPRPS